MINKILWKSNKKNVISRSGVEAKHPMIAQSVCGIMWIYQFLTEIGQKISKQAKLWCNNQAAHHITSNLVFHE